MCAQQAGRVELQPSWLLHRRPYRETSLLLEVFTRDHGRLPLVARGARRGRRGAGVELQPFRPLLLGFGLRGEMGSLHAAEPDPAAPSAPLAGAALASGFYVNELLMRLVHRFDPHPALFGVYRHTLAALAEPATLEAALRRFEKRLLEEAGYGPSFTHDAESGAPVRADRRYVFVIERGAREATGTGSTDMRSTVAGSTLLDLDAGRFGDPVTRIEAKRLMRRIIDHHLGGRPLQSRTLLRQPRDDGG